MCTNVHARNEFYGVASFTLYVVLYEEERKHTCTTHLCVKSTMQIHAIFISSDYDRAIAYVWGWTGIKGIS